MLAVGLAAASAPAAVAQILPEADAVAAVPAPILDRVRRDPGAYFRFVNRPWIERVCRVFAGEIRSMRVVRLHGDAHVEQYALTHDAWGLDDFDDSARGPAVVDIVRFLGSVDLIARQRGWTAHREALFDRFAAAYRRGVSEPDYRPPEPAIVRRLRTDPFPSREAFLASGEAKMQPMSAAMVDRIVTALRVFTGQLRKERPDLPPTYLGFVRAGWLRMGIGSAGDLKLLVRVQGPSSSPTDDELLEAKRARYLGDLPCLDVVDVSATTRIVLGSRHVGRLKHSILMAAPDVVPELGADAHRLRHWFIRSWDPTYREIAVQDLVSYQDLSDIVYDAGVQLGQGSLREEEGAGVAALRRQVLATIGKFERRVRTGTVALVDELMLGWKQFAAAAPRD
jgi:hypothetical protein